MTRSVRRFQATVAAQVIVPPPGTPSWWSDNTLHPEGTWQVYATNGETVTTSAGSTTASDTRQRGASLYVTWPSTTIPSSLFEYCGGAIDQTLLRMFMTGGGHDHTDNSVVMLDLAAKNGGVDQPRWYKINPDTSNGTRYTQPANGNGQNDVDWAAQNGRITACHIQQDIFCQNGYLWIPGMWANTNNTGTGIDYLGTTTSKFKMATNQTPGTTFAWSRIGRAIDADGVGFGGGSGVVTLVESRNEILRSSQSTVTGTPYCNYNVSTLDGSTTQYLTRGTAFTTSGLNNKVKTLPAGQTAFEGQSIACEIYPGGGRPAFMLYYGTGSMGSGWWLFDPANMNVVYGPLNMVLGAGVPALPALTHSGYSSLKHLHGTNKIYMSWLDGSTTTATFGRITVPAGTTGEALANATWNLDVVSPSAATGGALPPAHAVLAMAGKFNLVQDMGDGRPALITVSIPGSTYGLKPHVWICKMPVGGL